MLVYATLSLPINWRGVLARGCNPGLVLWITITNELLYIQRQSPALLTENR